MDESAVVDRIVDNAHAVLLVGEQEREVIVPLADLPPAAGEGTWLRARFEGNALVEAAIDAAATDQMRARLARKMEKLRRRGRRPG